MVIDFMSQKSHLTEEFEKQFGNLNSRIEMMQKTQAETMEPFLTQLPENVSLNLKKIIAASYLLCLTEEIFQVTFEHFKNDIMAFCTLMGFNFEKLVEISDEEFILQYLNPFMKILSISSNALQEMLKTFIVELATGYSQELVKTLVIINFLQPLFLQIINVIQINVDLRFICAIVTTTVEDFIDRKYRLRKGQEIGEFSIVVLYDEFKELYPLSQGEDLIFDMCNRLTLERTWTSLDKLVRREVDALSESIIEQREDSLAQYHANVAREKEKYSDDYYVSMITGRLFELFVLERPMTDLLRTGIVNAVDVMIRRYLIDKHGYASASGEETLHIACSLLWESVWELPQIMATFLEPHEIMEIMKMDDPRQWVKKSERDFKARFCRSLTRLSGKNPLPAVIGNAFVKMLEKAQRMRVRITFD